jgi:septal ring factor EnvC (AmiA/AmiB activator)
MNKALAHQSALRVELEQIKAQLQEINEEKEKELAKNSGKANNEAVIRRLDNERQYLKSQLASEITHKNEVFQ